MGVDDFQDRHCPHPGHWERDNYGKGPSGHWHRVVFGKEICGAQCSARCWWGEHEKCGGTIPNYECACPCHHNPHALWWRTALSLLSNRKGVSADE